MSHARLIGYVLACLAALLFAASENTSHAQSQSRSQQQLFQRYQLEQQRRQQRLMLEQQRRQQPQVSEQQRRMEEAARQQQEMLRGQQEALRSRQLEKDRYRTRQDLRVRPPAKGPTARLPRLRARKGDVTAIRTALIGAAGENFTQAPADRPAVQAEAELDDPPAPQTSLPAHEVLPVPSDPTPEQKAGAQEYRVDIKYVDAYGRLIFPNQQNSGFRNGFFGTPKRRKLTPGAHFDRYGGYEDKDGNFIDGGIFAAPVGVSISQRALPAGYDKRPLTEYRVKKPISTLEGPAAPWFGQEGMGTQYLFEWPPDIDDALNNLPKSQQVRCSRDEYYATMDCLRLTGYIEIVTKDR